MPSPGTSSRGIHPALTSCRRPRPGHPSQDRESPRRDEMMERRTFVSDAKPGDLPVEQPTKFELIVKPRDRQGARAHDPAVATAAGRSGDRLISRTLPECDATDRNNDDAQF